MVFNVCYWVYYTQIAKWVQKIYHWYIIIYAYILIRITGYINCDCDVKKKHWWLIYVSCVDQREKNEYVIRYDISIYRKKCRYVQISTSKYLWFWLTNLLHYMYKTCPSSKKSYWLGHHISKRVYSIVCFKIRNKKFC